MVHFSMRLASLDDGVGWAAVLMGFKHALFFSFFFYNGARPGARGSGWRKLAGDYAKQMTASLAGPLE